MVHDTKEMYNKEKSISVVLVLSNRFQFLNIVEYSVLPETFIILIW